MNLLVKAIQGRFERALQDSGAYERKPAPRLDYKVNAKGELVIAAILPPTWPDEWVMAERRR